MSIDLAKIEAILDDPSISTAEIARHTGLSESVISRIRSGKRPLDNVTLGSVKKFQSWIDGK